MNTSVSSLVKQGQDLADSANENVSALRSAAKPVVQRAAKQAQSRGEQALGLAEDLTSQAREAISNVSDSAIAYARKNPARALGIAAGVGVALYAVLKTLQRARD